MYGAPTTSAAIRPTSKRKSADANDLGVDDPMQVRQRAYPVSSCVARNFKRGGGIISTPFSNVYFFRQNQFEAD